MLALATFNRFVVMPKLQANTSAEIVPMTGLRASVTCELMLGFVVVGVAAVLGITPPPQ